MLLNQLVRINEQGLVANAVSFELMDDPDKNLQLCRGFVFNYDSDPKKLKSSTVGVLYALRRSFHSPSEPNIHLMVQDYGKGKSHFALAVGNFFQKPDHSPEVQGVLQQVEYATPNSKAILEDLKLYKQLGRNLVICLSGDKPIDLKKHFLQALRKALESEGVTDSIAQQICQQPLQYLESLNPENREAASVYLERLGNPEGDLNTIMQLLRDDSYQVIPRVKEICRELTGVTPDFDADVDVEAILSDIITQLCTSENRRFQGILILFDELYNYLQLWANDPVRAGSSTLQNITNICEKFKGRIALISFTQRRPKSVIPPKHVEDYNRLVSRLELLPSTYEPVASLELVLDGLLNQQDKTAAWQEFFTEWLDTLNAFSTNIYQNRTANYYQSRNWSSQKFLTHITLGCFPLHPLTSYLLCNLDFTQGRTAIQFVQEDVKNFIIEQPVKKNDNLNLIYPVALVDAFLGNFSNPEANPEYSTVFSDYNYSANKIKTSADADPDEMSVLKGLLLFYTSGGKLVKLDREKHEELLSLLTGISVVKVKTTLDKLCQNREVIYHNPADNTYRFYAGGFGIEELRRRIKDEIGTKFISIDRVETHCQLNITQYAGSDTIPTQFVELNRLRHEDWRFQNKVFTDVKFRQALLSDQILRNIDASGIVAYVVAETSEELLALRNEINQLLDRSPIKGQVVVAITSQPTGKLARLLLESGIVEKKSVQDFGAAVTQLKQQYQKQIHDSTRDLLNSCTYHCHILEKIPMGDRSNPSQIVSAILQDRYPLVPTVDSNDKMYLRSSTGSEVIGYVSKRILENDLRPQAFPKKSYENIVKPVFVNSWGLLKPSNQQYSVVVPTQRNIKAAWDKISEMTTLGEQSEKVVKIAQIWETLSSPPYGYNEYTFTILFAGWLAYHRSEVFLKGGFGIPQRKLDSVPIRTEPIKDWASTNILNKPKDFIHEWVLNQAKPQLIRRKPLPCPEVPNSVDYDQARQLIEDINNFLFNPPDSAKANEITNTRQKLTTGVERINEQFEPVSQAENLLMAAFLPGQADIELSMRIYSQLQQPLSVIINDGLSISPTEQQQRQHTQVLQTVIERIGQVVEVESERSQSLRTEADCGAYKADIQRIIAQISQADLPTRFVETLQDALQATDIRLAEIVEQRKVENAVEQIQSLYNSLSALATQREYVDIQTQIENLVAVVPATRETNIYRNIIQTLEEKQDALIQQVVDWEGQFSPAISRPLAMQLSQSINRQLNRFTGEESQQRLDELLRCLDNIILERESEEQEEEELNDILDSARQKLQNIKTLKNLSDAFQAYQELFKLAFTPVSKESIQEKEKQLENFKSEGYTVICQKILQIIELCQQQLNQSQDSDKFQSLLQQGKVIVASSDEFATFKNSLEEAERNLEVQQEDLQKRLQDRRSLENIRQQSLAKANTIHICEEAITAITSLRNQLNYPEQFTPEVDKLLQAFRDKVATYNRNLQNLRDRLSTIKTAKDLDSIKNEYAKLDLVFKDSSEYPTYQQLQAQIGFLTEDLERISHLERYQQSNSITSCDRALEIIRNEQVNLHYLDRFRPQLLQLEEHLHQTKQGYIVQLNKLYGKLDSIKTLKEAQKLQRELVDRSANYRESQEEQRYEAICSEVNQLINLLQISETQKVDTVQACQVERERLLQWRDTEEITQQLQTLLESMLANLEQTQQQIEKEQQSAARTWLEILENQDTRLEQFTDSVKKLEAASQLLKQIKKQRNQHKQMLEAEQKHTVERIINHCLEIQNQDRESTILVLFQKLPREQRENLHKRLAEYLSSTTEEL